MSRTLNSLSCSRLALPLFNTSAQEMLTVFNRFNFDDPLLQKVLAKLAACTLKFHQFFDRQRTSIFTKPVNDKLKIQSKIYHGFYGMVVSMARLPESIEQKAASQILMILNNYGAEVYREGQSEQAFHIGSLLEDFKKPEMIVALKNANVAQYAQNLASAHLEYQAISDERIIHEANEGGPDILQLKDDLIYYVSSLLSYIDLAIDLEYGPFKPVDTELNIIIARTMATHRAAQTRLENEAQDNGASEAPKAATEAIGK